MRLLLLNIENEGLWHELEVEDVTFEFYYHLHQSSIESPRHILSMIEEFDGPLRLTKQVETWREETKAEIELYDRVQTAKKLASSLLS